MKAVFEMTTARTDTSGKTTMLLTHSCSNHCVIQVGSLGSDAMSEVVEISDARFSVTLIVKMTCTENYDGPRWHSILVSAAGRSSICSIISPAV